MFSPNPFEVIPNGVGTMFSHAIPTKPVLDTFSMMDSTKGIWVHTHDIRPSWICSKSPEKDYII